MKVSKFAVVCLLTTNGLPEALGGRLGSSLFAASNTTAHDVEEEEGAYLAKVHRLLDEANAEECVIPESTNEKAFPNDPLLRDNMITLFRGTKSTVKFDNCSLRKAVKLWVDDKEMAEAMYGPMSTWDVSQVTNMAALFYGLKTFNEPIGSWKMSNVKVTRNMFLGAEVFNQPLNDWDVGNLRIAQGMFQDAVAFNQPLNKWKPRNLNQASYMFQNAASFNQNVNDWGMYNLLWSVGMFKQAQSYNGRMDKWSPNRLKNASDMFNGAKAFDQVLCWISLGQAHTGNMMCGSQGYLNTCCASKEDIRKDCGGTGGDLGTCHDTYIVPFSGDTYTQGGASSQRNFGHDPLLLARQAVSPDERSEAYLEFDVKNWVKGIHPTWRGSKRTERRFQLTVAQANDPSPGMYRSGVANLFVMMFNGANFDASTFTQSGYGNLLSNGVVRLPPEQRNAGSQRRVMLKRYPLAGAGTQVSFSADPYFAQARYNNLDSIVFRLFVNYPRPFGFEVGFHSLEATKDRPGLLLTNVYTKPASLGVSFTLSHKVGGLGYQSGNPITTTYTGKICDGQGHIQWMSMATHGGDSWSREANAGNDEWLEGWVGKGCGDTPTAIAGIPSDVTASGVVVSYLKRHSVDSLCAEDKTVSTEYYGRSCGDGKIQWNTMKTLNREQPKCSWDRRKHAGDSVWLSTFVGGCGSSPTAVELPTSY